MIIHFFDMEQQPITIAQVGKPAPDFLLEGYSPDGAFKNYSLKDHRGKWVVLFFYPLDFTFICPTEITEFTSKNEDFAKLNAVILGASTDSCHSHKAWCEGSLGTQAFPLLSDMTHAVSRAYHVLLEDKGIALRGTFIIDKEGTVRFTEHNPVGERRNVEGYAEVLRGL
ncbi:peroxiredoxin [Candidatus Uhrbacteria bacterium]|nr:MAG: peroxiredoxin [Candidatus Uhrbacteria bacterium]